MVLGWFHILLTCVIYDNISLAGPNLNKAQLTRLNQLSEDFDGIALWYMALMSQTAWLVRPWWDINKCRIVANNTLNQLERQWPVPTLRLL